MAIASRKVTFDKVSCKTTVHASTAARTVPTSHRFRWTDIKETFHLGKRRQVLPGCYQCAAL